MADELVETRGEEAGYRLYESLTIEEQQAIYDTAAWDLLNWLNGLTPDERTAHFRNCERLDWQAANRETTRCARCGFPVMELKWGRGHKEWRCMEDSCGHRWGYKEAT